MKQIRDGCGKSHCTTLWCYSNEERRKQQPLRRYTALSAKSIALSLINRDDPFAALCPHILNAPTSSTTHDVASRNASSGSTEFSREGDETMQREQSEPSSRKDPKSLSQNLFDVFNLDDAVVGSQDSSSLCVLESDPLVDSVSKLTPALLQALIKLDSHKLYDHPVSPGEENANKKHHEAIRDFINQSIFYSFGHTGTLLEIAREVFMPGQHDGVQHHGVGGTMVRGMFTYGTLHRGLQVLTSHYAQTIFDSLWEALRAVFIKPSIPSKKKKRYLDDPDAAYVVIFCVNALAIAIDEDELDKHKMDEIDSLHYSDFLPLRHEDATFHAGRLANRLANVIHARNRCELANSIISGLRTPPKPFFSLVCAPFGWSEIILEHHKDQVKDMAWEAKEITMYLFLRWSKLLFLSAWDGASVIRDGTPAALHLGVLDSLCMFLIMHTSSVALTNRWSDARREYLGLPLSLFRVPAVSDGLDSSQLPSKWPFKPSDPSSIHILTYQFLFTPSKLISCFRAVNFSRMTQAYVMARTAESLPKRTQIPLTTAQTETLSKLIGAEKNPYLVLEVHRGHELDNALDQLWHRQKEELLRPLKVRYVGEPGFDIGGVSQEFFNVAFRKALNPDNGKSSLSHSQPCALQRFNCAQSLLITKVCLLSTKSQSTLGSKRSRSSQLLVLSFSESLCLWPYTTASSSPFRFHWLFI